MKKCALIFLSLLTIAQFSCKSFKTPIAKTWIFSYETGSKQDSAFSSANFLDIQPDGTFSSDFGTFDHGEWKRMDSLLILKGKNGGQIVFAAKLFGDNANELELKDNIGGLYFFGTNNNTDATKNPFSAANNQWRIKAPEKELEPELRKRLRNHCQFLARYCQWADDNDLSSLNTGDVPTLFNLYNNGIMMKEAEELPAAWRAYFYDTLDCRKANTMMVSVFRRNRIKLDPNKNSFKMLQEGFEQLEGILGK